jgi:glucans biosynthesis protein C
VVPAPDFEVVPMQSPVQSEAPLVAAPPAPPPAERFHALDGLRALAMLLGIYLHAALSFIPDFPAGVCPARDIHPHGGFGVLFLYIHAFRMPLFFLLAGFLGRMLHQRLGGREFLRHRFVRLVIPLVVGMAVFLPLMYVLYLHGNDIPDNSQAGGSDVWGVPGVTYPPLFSEHGPLLMHLWFLYYLMLLSLLAVGVRVLAGRVLSSAALGRVDGAMRWLVGSGWGVPVLGLLTLPLFHQMREWTIDTALTLVPDPKMLLFYGLFYGFGWLLHRQPGLLSGLERGAGRQVLLASFLLFPLLLVLMGRWLEAGRQGPALLKLAGLGLHSLITWGLVLGFTGLALRYLTRPRVTMRYLADGAYWMYLIHLPLVIFLQILFAEVDLPALVKFLLITKLALVLMLPSYEYLVRYTVIGRVLNGQRARKAPAPRLDVSAVG